ncbi:hypothetical protein EF910_32250 [Streptomyces sp. WAC07149]|nr:hypothetical protein EF910_32250 [Streptomyces sp. WAC07149]GLX21041.1 hypothetical protein Slala01_46850 [Streptomyces lavendulae subsp. lavendulae]GLX25675.1 hypothetical protein Slala02_14950 [Streptomyces lavendulae subsp. lavendulae]
MGAERAQGGRGWVRIPASRGEQPTARAAGQPPRTAAGQPPRGAAGASHGSSSYGASHGSSYGASYGWRSAGHFGAGDQPSIYLSLVKRWREAGRTLPGHPDEEWERLISQPCWPGR